MGDVEYSYTQNQKTLSEVYLEGSSYFWFVSRGSCRPFTTFILHRSWNAISYSSAGGRVTLHRLSTDPQQYPELFLYI